MVRSLALEAQSKAAASLRGLESEIEQLRGRVAQIEQQLADGAAQP